MVLLADAVARARSGDGAAIFVVGAAGIGKSALARAAVALARGRGVLALVGRAVPRPSPTPYRALTEALLTGVGGEGFPAGPEMRAFRAALGRLVPQWRVAGDVYAEESPVVLGAGLLRLLRVIAPAGALLVLDDLHWADPETTAVVEYLCDNLAGEPVAVLGTLRGEEMCEPGQVVEALCARGSASVVGLAPLDGSATADMVAACTLPAGIDMPAALDLVVTAEGVPLFVEELLGLAGDPVWPSPRPIRTCPASGVCSPPTWPTPCRAGLRASPGRSTPADRSGRR